MSVRNAEVEELKGIVALNREKIASIEVELELVKKMPKKEIQETKKLLRWRNVMRLEILKEKKMS